MRFFCQLVACVAGLLVIVAFCENARHGGKTAPPKQVAPAQPDEGLRRHPHLRPFRPLRESIEDPAPDQTEPIIDFPKELWFKNIGSRADGAGMCVDTAFELMCLYQGLTEFKGFRDWAAKYPGGGYPDKLAKQVKQFCKEKGIREPELRQVEDSDPAFLRKCLANGWMPMVTLFHSPRYKGPGGQVLPIIYHMTNCGHADAKWLCIVDNNFWPPEWCSFEEGMKRISNHGHYWAVAIVDRPAPPPPPTNRKGS